MSKEMKENEEPTSLACIHRSVGVHLAKMRGGCNRDSCMAIVGATSEPRHAIWSPCGQYIATGSGKNVEVRD